VTYFEVVKVNLDALRTVLLDERNDLLDVGVVGRGLRKRLELGGEAVILVRDSQDVGHLAQVVERGLIEEGVVFGIGVEVNSLGDIGALGIRPFGFVLALSRYELQIIKVNVALRI
jgi:hypothetical protein